MPTAHSLHRRANTRGRVRGGIFFSLEKWCIFGFCGVQEKPPGVM
jgi:hypothetical protein